MDGTEITFLGGLVLGLASTLHCSAMCGAISCSALLSLSPQSGWDRVRYAVLLNLGRILAYATLGIAAALIGSAIIKPETTMNYRVLQYIGAAVLMWTGLSMAGMMPRFALLDGAMTRLSGTVATITRPLQGTAAAPLGSGRHLGSEPLPDGLRRPLHGDAHRVCLGRLVCHGRLRPGNTSRRASSRVSASHPCGVSKRAARSRLRPA